MEDSIINKISIKMKDRKFKEIRMKIFTHKDLKKCKAWKNKIYSMLNKSTNMSWNNPKT